MDTIMSSSSRRRRRRRRRRRLLLKMGHFIISVQFILRKT
jgi:hypothetical protein